MLKPSPAIARSCRFVLALGLALSLVPAAGLAGGPLPASAAPALPAGPSGEAGRRMAGPSAAPDASFGPPLWESHERVLSVKFKDAGDLPGLHRLSSALGAAAVRHNQDTGIHTLKVPAGSAISTILDQLAADPAVEWAEEAKWRRIHDLPRLPLVPNDTLYASGQKWYYDAINAPEGWSTETGKKTVLIAVLDSGVLCSHPDLAGRIWVNSKEIPGNGIDDDNNGYKDDVNGYDFVGGETGNESSADLPGDGDPCLKSGDPSLGNGIDDDGSGVADDGVFHGTFVAGVIAANGNNNTGVAGMCWSCSVMPVRIANPEGWLRSSDTEQGVAYAAKNGAKIINMSLGGPDMSMAERAAVDLAVNTYGATLVASAGNANKSPIEYPAQLSNVVAVGASDHSNIRGRAFFSNWGTGSTNNRQVDVVAPGVDIDSTVVISMADQAAGRGSAGSADYTRSAGTSFSAPLVSGLAGLLLSRNPALSWSQLRDNIRNTATALGDDLADSPNAGATWAGAGLVNVGAALASTSVPFTGTPQPVSPVAGVLLTGLGTTLNWSLPAGATQYQVQVLPFNNDGPAINLIRNAASSYTVTPPLFGTGPYVMLPSMTYTWRVRATNATTGIDENSTAWGPWSPNLAFKTRAASAGGMTALSPADGSQVLTRTPTLTWTDSDTTQFYYEVQISKDPDFGAKGPKAMVYWELRHGGATTPRNSYAVPAAFPLEAATKYYWRVRPRVQGDGTPVSWSRTYTLTTS